MMPCAYMQVKNISCGAFTTYFLTEDDELWVCGANRRNQLGIMGHSSRIVVSMLVCLYHVCVRVHFFFGVLVLLYLCIFCCCSLCVRVGGCICLLMC